MLSCLNCQSPLAPGQRFCGHCGQKSATRRLTLHDIGHEVWHAMTHTDHSVLGLIKALLTRPGEVAREFVQGQRKRYFNPFTFLVVAVGLSSLAMVWAGIGFNDPKLHPGPVGRFLQRNLNLYFLLQVPLLALWGRVLFRKNGMNLAENLVLGAYATGLRSLGLLLLVAPLAAGLNAMAEPSSGSLLVRLPDAVFALAWTLFFGWASAQFHCGASWRARDWLKGCAVELLAFTTSFAAIFVTFVLWFRFYSPSAQ